MRRPLCVFCAGMLGVELVCAFLPQTDVKCPFAAFFIGVCLFLLIFDRTRRFSICLLLGAAAGALSVMHTDARLERLRVQNAGRMVVLTAEVEQITAVRAGGVDAVLWVEQVNGRDTAFRVQCGLMPQCEAGQRIRGKFELSPPGEGSRLSLYADDIALEADFLEELVVLGQSSSFRARTHRLQTRLSASLRRCMDADTGGVLAAMTVGDRSFLSAALKKAYRGAGLAHILVVSGMHVSILCGGAFQLPGRRRKERSYRSRRREALLRAALALILVGVTGFTPSVRRAAVAVWISALGVWVYGPPDALTSLAAAGVLMTAGNSYAVCDVGFELSFAAVMGTLAGAALARRVRAVHGRRYRKAGWLRRKMTDLRWQLLDALCISGCASAATFPVLVLRGMSVSLYAVVSSVAVLWLVQPVLLVGLAVAFTGLLPAAAPLYELLSLAASALMRLLNSWALWVSALPGADLRFGTPYAALAGLAALGAGWLIWRRPHSRKRLLAAFLLAALAVWIAAFLLAGGELPDAFKTAASVIQ